MKQYKASKNLIELLKRVQIEGSTLLLPETKIDNSLLKEFHKAIRAMGGQQKGDSYEFPYAVDIERNRIIEEGTIVKWNEEKVIPVGDRLLSTMLNKVFLYQGGAYDVLIPNAKDGEVADYIKNIFPQANIYCVERNPFFQEKLECNEYDIIKQSFLKTKAGDPAMMDLILVNPDKNEQAATIRHAYEWLAEGGYLLALFNQDDFHNGKREVPFKMWLSKVKYQSYIFDKEAFAGKTQKAFLLIEK